MKTRYYWTVVALVVAVLAIAAVVTRSSTVAYTALGAVTCLVIGLTAGALAKSPKAQAFLKAKRFLFLIGGVLLAIAGLVVSVSLRTLIGGDAEWPTQVGAITMLAGVFVAMMPRIAAQTQAAAVEHAILEAAPGPTSKFQGVAEGLDAGIAPMRHGAMFLRLAGPWLLVIIGLFAGVGTAAKIEDESAQTTAMLTWVLPALLVLLVAIPTFAVAWCRWILRRETPRFCLALPGRAAFSVGWRLWIASSILATLGGWVSAGMVKVVGESATASATTDFVGKAVNLAALALASNMAARLVALALNDPGLTLTGAQVQSRRLGGALPFGFLIAVGPFYLVSWLLDRVTDSLAPDAKGMDLFVGPMALATTIVGLTVFFAGLAAATTYVARVYERVKSTASAATPS